MATAAQKKASASHRHRAAERGLIRVEVQATDNDAAIIRDLARVLREEPMKSAGLRKLLVVALETDAPGDALSIFGSDLPDEAFEGVFDQVRETGWRPVSL